MKGILLCYPCSMKVYFMQLLAAWDFFNIYFCLKNNHPFRKGKPSIKHPVLSLAGLPFRMQEGILNPFLLCFKLTFLQEIIFSHICDSSMFKN